MPRTWQPLSVSGHGVPGLLVSFDFAVRSYSLSVTDLGNLWAATQDRASIFVQARRDHSVIDPSDGPDQLEKLLDLLLTALDHRRPGHRDTSLAISREQAGSGDGDGLLLSLTCELPKPLKPFKWAVHLTKCPPSALASELVLPLIRTLHFCRQDTDALVRALKEKDNVISKLADKIESSSGLENVFATLPARKGVTRAFAEGRIKGLAPFEEKTFQEQSDKQTRGSGSADLVKDLFGKGIPCCSLAPAGNENSSLTDDWWLQLKRGQEITLDASQTSQTAGRSSCDELKSSAEVDNDDDFQVQASQPRHRAVREVSLPKQQQDAHEISDGDNSEVPDSLPVEPGRSGRLGGIGGRARASRASASPTESSPSAKTASPSTKTPTKWKAKRKPANEDETASESEGEPMKSPSPPPLSQRKRGGFGRIGGKVKSPTPQPARVDDDTASSSAASPARVSPSQRLKRRKLGAIGGGKRVASPTPSPPRKSPARTRLGRIGGKARGRSASPAEAVCEERGKDEEQDSRSPAEETNEQRVTRRRAELQRDLEKKTAAPAKKKKRKF